MPDTITVNGSHGTLTIDRASGVIVEADHWNDPSDPEGYRNIALFDTIPFQREPEAAHFDILGTAYITTDGHYEPALTPVWSTARYRDRSGRWQTDFGVDGWEPLALLPPPQYHVCLNA